ncbi:MAG: RraA family protein [Deltaproteobacteria bacterium]|nr:RraA family protein [Deltaproteobacteria bacterium]MBW1962072.1 RraA family protein [Deltaproteobacteria bacterium]MBW1995858.1 RraA family protein [Deltaproteobacteria bacterium]MBW2153714.1 RraA family protein [Deltaproteobacteria bacterium]
MIVKERVNPFNHELIEKFKAVEPPTVGHFRHDGFMSPRIRPLFPEAAMVGPAVTVKTPANDSTMVHKVLEVAQPGDVIVVDRCGDTMHACWGGVVTMAAHLRKIAGAVIDGVATDLLEIIELKFPVYCTGTSAITTKILGLGGEINTPVQCGGVVVHPGDLVCADANGVLVLSPKDVKSVMEEALRRQEREKTVIERLRQGENLADISAANKLIREKGR